VNDKPIDSMSDLERDNMRKDVKTVEQVLAEIGFNNLDEEVQKAKNAKFMAERKQI